MKPVYVKDHAWEVGIGSIEAERLWESTVNSDTGDFCHLARIPNGELRLSWTDMEEYDGSYISCRVTEDDIRRLAGALDSTEPQP